jgi:putative DNA primase/helicase
MNQTFQNAGILVQQFIPDGVIHRVGTIDKPRSKNGWYTGVELNGHTYVTCGNWVTDETHRWCSKEGESTEINENWKMLAKLAQQEQEKKNAEAQRKAEELIPTLLLATEHPYLTKKNIKPFGALVQGNKLIVPIYNNESLVGYQRIYEDGFKKPIYGTKMKASYYIIKQVSTTIYVCEGYATGCTIAEATGKTVVIAFNAGNLKRVCEELKGQNLVVCADNDEPKDKYPDVGGCGVYHANKTGETLKFPVTLGDFNDIGVDETKQILEPLVGVYTPDKVESEQVLFPTDEVYAGAPDVYKRIYDEWLDSVTEPIAGFAFATIEAAMQVLCGQKVLTPGHARTVVTYSLCGSHSGAGKDLSSKNPLRKLREQLIAGCTGGMGGILFEKLTTGIGNITGDTAFLNQANETQGSFLWLTTEASEPLRQLSANSSMANQGSSLATALNDSYDGHEVTGKRKAGGAVAAVNYPNIPVCWLTQLKELKKQLTQELLEIGTLGRFDYVLDYNPEKAIRSSFEGGLVVGADATQEDIVKASKGFSDQTIATILHKVGNIFEGQVAWRKDAYNYIMDYDIGLKEKYDSTDGIGKFLCRTSMSVEKRLTAWVAMDGRNVIELSDVKAIMPWFEYQVAMREQVYMREIKDTIEKVFMQGKGIVTSKSKNKAQEYAKLIGKGIVSRADFHAKFDALYSDDFPKYLERSAMTRELEQYVKEGDICMGQQPGGFRATTQFVWIPED